VKSLIQIVTEQIKASIFARRYLFLLELKSPLVIVNELKISSLVFLQSFHTKICGIHKKNFFSLHVVLVHIFEKIFLLKVSTLIYLFAR